MLRFVTLRALVFCVASLLCFSQNAKPASGIEHPASVERGLALATGGRCAEAIPILRKTLPSLPGSDLKKRAGLAAIRCAMTRNQPYEAVGFLEIMTRDFPRDPEVLYQATHAYSDLSIRASQDLLRDAPRSYQAYELSAESLEMQGKWDEASDQYKKILKTNPDLPGIHYRLGRILLSKPNPGPELAAEAKKNFEEELKIDRQNAGAEYVLGELARQDSNWTDAVEHFSRATTLDHGFAEAYLGLGISLISEKRFPDAVAPLQSAARLQPENPEAHYNLAIALSRAGRKEEADREFAIHRKLQESAPSPSAPPQPD